MPPPAPLVAHPRHPPPVHYEPEGLGVGSDLQVVATAGRFQIGGGGALAPPISLGDLVVPDAVLSLAVVVGVTLESAFDPGVDERVDDLVVLAHVGDVQRPVSAADLVPAALEVLRFPEVGQDVGVGPAAVAELRPRIIVESLSAHVKHAVDRARAADHLAPRNREPTPPEVVVGLGLEKPVQGGVVEQLLKADRHPNPDAAVLAAGFEEEHPAARVRAQPVGHHATGGAGPDDNEVVGQVITLSFV